MDASTYMETRLLTKQCLPTPPCKAPFPMILNKSGCLVDANTPEEAIELGLLPKDWMNCSDTSSVFAVSPY